MNSRAVEQNWETSIRRRTLLRFVLTLGTALGLFSALVPAAVGAQEGGQARVDVTVVEVSGLVDRIQARFLRSVLESTDHDVVVVRLDSRGAVASEEELAALESAIEASAAPVAVWLGPGRGARAEGGSERIAAAASVAGGVPGSRAEGVEIDADFPTLGDFIVGLDESVDISIPTEVVRREGRPPQRELADSVRVSFAEPPFFEQMLHAVSTPTAAYLLVTAGLLLLVFEFFTGGIGVAAAVAVVCLGMGGFGLGALPTRPAALAVLAAAILGFSIDVQVGVPRAWTVIGTVLFSAGSLLLFDGIAVPLFVVVAMVAAVIVVMVAGMPAVVRTRYSTPTIGRASMVGELGTASTSIAPDGVAIVRDAPWRARTNRATPIEAGAAIRVAAIDGLLLEVEPLEGAAEDYREKARRPQ